MNFQKLPSCVQRLVMVSLICLSSITVSCIQVLKIIIQILVEFYFCQICFWNLFINGLFLSNNTILCSTFTFVIMWWFISVPCSYSVCYPINSSILVHTTLLQVTTKHFRVWNVRHVFIRCSSRELQRLDSLSRAPVFSHFSDTLTG